MKTRHVTDPEIQQYIFDKTNCSHDTIQHINSCDVCMHIVDSYQLLSKELKQQNTPVLEYNLADKVLEKIAIPTQQKQHFKNYTAISAIICIAIGMLLILLDTLNSTTYVFFDIDKVSIYFISCIGFFITLLWSIDMIRTFNIKMTNIRYS